MFDAIVDIYRLNSKGHIKPGPDIGSGISRANSDAAVSYSESDIFGRYSYVSGPTVLGTSGSSNVLLYDIVVQNTFKEATSPLFATMISGSMRPEGNDIDSERIPFLLESAGSTNSGSIDISSGNSYVNSTLVDNPYSPFAWRSKTTGEQLSLGVLSNPFTSSDETDSILQDRPSKLNSFSYISIPSLNSGGKMVVGVIHSDGTPIKNKASMLVPLGYTVLKEGYGIWKIIFDTKFEEIPTLIAQPTWTASPEDMPKSTAQLSLAVRDCSTKECTVYLGSENFQVSDDGGLYVDDGENTFVNDHLGLSFLAMDGNLTSSSVLHGRVSITHSSSMTSSTAPSVVPAPSSSPTSLDNSTAKNGWTAQGLETTNSRKHQINILSSEHDDVIVKTFSSDQNYTFVELTFVNEFIEPPSVLVTPLIFTDTNTNGTAHPFQRIHHNHHQEESSYSLEKKSFVSVEYITEKKALIQVGMIDTISLGTNVDGAKLFESLPFSFLVVGPLHKTYVEPNSEEDDTLVCTQVPSMSPSSSGKGKVTSKGGSTKSPSQQQHLRSKSQKKTAAPTSLPPTNSPTTPSISTTNVSGLTTSACAAMEPSLMLISSLLLGLLCFFI